jgi:hypothetical protein
MDRIRFGARRRRIDFWDALFRNPLVVAAIGFGLAWFVYDWVRRNDWVLERFSFGPRDTAWDDQVVYGGMQAPANQSDGSPFDGARNVARRVAGGVAMKAEELGATAEQMGSQARERADDLGDQVQDFIRASRAQRFMREQDNNPD